MVNDIDCTETVKTMWPLDKANSILLNIIQSDKILQNKLCPYCLFFLNASALN